MSCYMAVRGSKNITDSVPQLGIDGEGNESRGGVQLMQVRTGPNNQLAGSAFAALISSMFP